MVFFIGGRISSRRRMFSGQGKVSILRCTMVRRDDRGIPALRMAASSASRPAVKFRLTGRFPGEEHGEIRQDGPLARRQDDADPLARNLGS